MGARNEFHVKDCDSHSPSVHSDNSSGSTTSFTVTDIGDTIRLTNSGESSFVTSRQKWNVVSASESNKRSGFATDSLEPDEKKIRKATLFDSGAGTILGKAAELGKDLMNAGAKLFKSGKSKDDGELTAMETSSVTSCEATTSHQNGKASSSSHQDSEYENRGRKKQKKKKKKQKRSEDSDSEFWEEKTKENLSKFVQPSDESTCKISTFNPNAPIKNWDSKPAPDTGPVTSGRSVTWDGRKSTNITDQLNKASEIRSWGGERSTLEKKDPEHRKRSAGQELDAEIDTGRVKKIRKQERDEPTRWGKENPFQIAQDHRNRGEDFSERREFRRHSDGFSRHDKSRHSDSYHGGRHSDQFYRNHSSRFSDHGPSGSNRDQHFSHHKYRNDHYSRYDGPKKFRR